MSLQINFKFWFLNVFCVFDWITFKISPFTNYLKYPTPKCCLQVKKLFTEIVTGSDYKKQQKWDIFKKLNYQHSSLNDDYKLLPQLSSYSSIIWIGILDKWIMDLFWCYWRLFAAFVTLLFIVYIMTKKRERYTERRVKIEKVQTRRYQRERIYYRRY